MPKLNQDVKIWAKNPSHFSPIEKERAKSLSSASNKSLISAEGRKEGPISFSKAMPHGEENNNLETVMMTKIREDTVFVHASDIQLLNDASIAQILSWQPDIALVGGPPIYLDKLSESQVKKAWYNAKELSQKIDTLILDHHLMRSYDGVKWLKGLSSATGKKVICGADFMKKPRMFLEADREDLYKKMSVPEGWHKDYAEGKVKAD